jgi:hypothetical protein
LDIDVETLDMDVERLGVDLERVAIGVKGFAIDMKGLDTDVERLAMPGMTLVDDVEGKPSIERPVILEQFTADATSGGPIPAALRVVAPSGTSGAPR